MSIFKLSNDVKKEFLNEAFDLGQCIIVVDGSKDGVVLPPYLLTSERVSLRISRTLALRLDITETELSARLSFNKQNFDVTLPLDAIYGLWFDEDTLVTFPESTPLSILRQIKPNEVESEENTLSFQDEVKSLTKRKKEKKLKIFARNF